MKILRRGDQMKVHVETEENEEMSAIKIASEIIDSVYDNVSYGEEIDFLKEVAEHIKIFCNIREN